MQTAIIIIVLTSLAGLGLFVAGIYLLFGLGWSFIAGGFSCLCISAFIRHGLVQKG